MKQLRFLGIVPFAGAVLCLVGCGSSSALSESEIKQALAKQPLTYDYRDEQYSSDGAVVGGTASKGRAVVTFEIVSGKPEITDPLFPQDSNSLKIQRGVTKDYTVTFNLPPGSAAGRRQAPIANEIDGAVCELRDDCGGPAG